MKGTIIPTFIIEENAKLSRRYRWLRKQLASGEESYIGEWITSEDELDSYIDSMLEKEGE